MIKTVQTYKVNTTRLVLNGKVFTNDEILSERDLQGHNVKSLMREKWIESIKSASQIAKEQKEAAKKAAEEEKAKKAEAEALAKEEAEKAKLEAEKKAKEEAEALAKDDAEKAAALKTVDAAKDNSTNNGSQR